MVEYSFKGKVVQDLDKLGLEEKTTITYPIDYLLGFLKRSKGKEVIINMTLKER